MKKPWMEMSLRDFQSALASSSPTPGGGTAAAVALGQASALAVMVCDLTLGNEKWKEGWVVAETIMSNAITTMSRASELADEDSDAFDAVMAAYKMPKNDEKEIEERREAIRSATLKATEVPFETAKLALELLEQLVELANVGNSNAISDVGVSGLLASAACKGGLFNVEINLSSLPEHYAKEIREESPLIMVKSKKLSRQIMDNVKGNI